MSLHAACGSRHRHSTTVRLSRPIVDQLETRTLLSTTAASHPTFVLGPLGGTGPANGFTPAQLQTAYGFNNISINGATGTGSDETIAIVDAYNDPDITSNLATFDGEFSLSAPPSFSVVNQTGGATLPGTDPTGGWELEESLDVEWAHAMAPDANILLVEASSSSTTALLAAVKYAAANASVVSMSWGGSEFSGETSYDGDFDESGVVFVASSGDSGAPADWPSVSPNVLGVGGTDLTLTSSNAWSSETGWSDSTGGPSEYESQPSYQTGVVTQQSTKRAAPDVAYDADTSTGVSVYDSYPYEGETLDWVEVGGTSVGAPNWSALLAIADQARKAAGESALNSTSDQQVMDILYQNTSDFHDITSGTSDGDPNYSAGPGYDYVTGIGTPIANEVVSSLVGTVAPHDTLVLSASTSETAGNSFSLTVTAENSSGQTDTSFTGTIDFTSTDPQASLPSLTITSSDDGTATVSVTLKTAATQSITGTETTNSAVTGTLQGIVVSPATASKFLISGLPSTVTAGTSESFTVTAEDPYGNIATGYSGTVKFTSSDSAASLPGQSNFTSANDGVESFAATFETAGSQSLTVTDVSSGITGTDSTIAVNPATPTGLVATTASSSQINLNWNSAAGATGYEVERSLNSTSGFTEIATATTTSYSNTGLTAGTTYYYQVIATGGGNTSAASNTASATTTGSAPVTESIWGTSYKPSVNSYYDGERGQTFELGVQFESNVAGEVTGVLFYKQRGTTGTNVGHLWSSSGTLLASVTFANETASGWQTALFSSPVQISANTFYTVSYDTGSQLFYYDSEYFAKGGVTNGNLTAPSYTDINNVILDNGVYNYGGDFPIASQYYANFWVDLRFSTSSSTTSKPTQVSRLTQQAIVPPGNGMSALPPGQTSPVRISPKATTPAGPAICLAASRGTTPTILGALPNRTQITQLGAIGSLFMKSAEV
jgi:hypothetical protein